MPTGIGPTFVTQPSVVAVTFLPADTTVAKSILTAPGGPWRLLAINVTSDDTAAQVIRIFTRTGAVNFLLASLALPAGAGTAGAAPKELFADIMPSTEQGIDFQGAVSLQASMEAAISAGKTITVTVLFGTY